MSDSDHIEYSTTISAVRQTGPPHVVVHDRDEREIQLYPTKHGPLVLWFSVDDWRKLNAAVEAAITESEQAQVTVS